MSDLFSEYFRRAQDRMRPPESLDPIRESGESIAHRLMDERAATYREEPVSPERFFNDEYYSGPLATSAIWPEVRKSMIRACQSDVREVHLAGAAGTGKTWEAVGIGVYDAYDLECRRNAATSLGKIRGQEFVFGLMNTNEQKAKTVSFAYFTTVLRQSEWFKARSPEFGKEQIRLSCGVRIIPMPTDEGAPLSLDLYWFHLDEASKQKKVMQSKSAARDDDGFRDIAKKVVENARRRNRNRFQSERGWFGRLLYSSQAESPQDYFEQQMAEAQANGLLVDGSRYCDEQGPIISADMRPYVYIRRLSIWEARPQGDYSSKTFPVELGEGRFATRVLKPGGTPRPGAKFIYPPVNFFEDFNRDADEACRELGGIALSSKRRLIGNVEKLRATIRTQPRYGAHQCVHPMVMKDDGAPILISDTRSSHIINHPVLAHRPDKDDPGMVPIVNPRAIRHAHLDYATKRDRAALAIGHIHGSKLVEKWSMGEKRILRLPDFYQDAVYVARANQSTDDLVAFEWFEYILREHLAMGFLIRECTVDRYAGPIAVERIKALGIMSCIRSVDKDDEPYLQWRSACYEGRYSSYNHDLVYQEAEEVEWFPDLAKVDHAPDKSKDATDAVVGSFYGATLWAEKVGVESATNPDAGDVTIAYPEGYSPQEEEADDDRFSNSSRGSRVDRWLG